MSDVPFIGPHAASETLRRILAKRSIAHSIRRLKMIDDIWLPEELTADIDLDLIPTVSRSLEYEISKVRAFVVALLEDVNDHEAAAKVNDVLIASE